MMGVFVVVIEVMVGAKLLFIQACRPAAGYVYWYRHQNCREYKVCAMRTLGRKRQRAKKILEAGTDGRGHNRRGPAACALSSSGVSTSSLHVQKSRGT